MYRLLAVLALIGGTAVVFLSGGGDFLSFLDAPSCSWEPVEIDGQTFDSLDDLESAAPADADLDAIRSEFDFDVRDGQLHYRASNCEPREVTPSQ